MNKKGFMMAELVVVSSVIIITLVGLYSSYNKIYSSYKARMSYYDIVTLYRLGYYRDILEENDKLDDAIIESRNGVVDVYNSIGPSGIFSLSEIERSQYLADRVFLVNNDGNMINKSSIETQGVKPSFLEYIDYFNNSIDYKKFNYVLIMERCLSTDANASDCSYAYLEVYENIDEVDAEPSDDEIGDDEVVVPVVTTSYYCNNHKGDSEPYRFVYTGNCDVHKSGGSEWNVKFLTSGNLTFTESCTVDAFWVGGGAGGNAGNTTFGGTGGGGGKTRQITSQSLNGGTTYSINIGKGGSGAIAGGASAKSGGSTSAFGYTVSGGTVDGGGRGTDIEKANDGSRGTYFFDKYYGAGGGGASGCGRNSDGVFSYGTPGVGGVTGGGNGASSDQCGNDVKSLSGSSAVDLTGGGGGGGAGSWHAHSYSSKAGDGGTGGSGIVIINFVV